MKRALKILLVLAVLLGVAMFVWITAQPSAPSAPVSGPIVLPDGSWMRIEAVTYGTNHLVGPPLAHVAKRMPPSVRGLMARTIGRRAIMRFSHTTPSPTLVLWLNRGIMAAPFPTNTGYLDCILSAPDGTVSGDAVRYAARYPLETQEFTVFPRREREIVLSIYYRDATGAVFKRGTVTFENPVHLRYPVWRPEPLPSTKHAGDVEVTLEKIRTGLDGHLDRSQTFTANRLDGTNVTVCLLRLRPTANTNEIWRVDSVETSDPTGNRIANKSLQQDNKAGYVMFSPALWASEPAWRLSFELKRTAGFKPDEQFILRTPELGNEATMHRVGWTTNLNGVTTVLGYILKREPPASRDHSPTNFASELRVRIDGLTNGLHLDLSAARTDDGSELSDGSWSGSLTDRTYLLRNLPPEANAVSFAFAVQRSRRVEFTVKPETGIVQLEASPGSVK